MINFLNFFFNYCKILICNIHKFGSIFFFYLLIIFLFPLSLGYIILANTLLISAILWIAIVLSTVLTLDILYKIDYDNGILDYFFLNPQKQLTITFAKMCAHWFIIILPLILIAIIFSFLLNLNIEKILVLFFSFLIGTPALVMLGTIGISLLLAHSQTNILLSLIVIPLYIPTLLFGITTITSFDYGFSVVFGNLSVLLAITIFCFIVSPYIIIFILKIGIKL